MWGKERKVDSLRVINEENFQLHLRSQSNMAFDESVKALRDFKKIKDE